MMFTDGVVGQTVVVAIWVNASSRRTRASDAAAFVNICSYNRHTQSHLFISFRITAGDLKWPPFKVRVTNPRTASTCTCSSSEL